MAGALTALAFAPASTRAAGRGADGRFDQRRSTHFVLYQDVAIERRSGWHGSLAFERDVLATLEGAYDRLDVLLGLRPRRPITVVVYDPGVFQQQFGGLFRFPTAGFYQGNIHVRGATRVTPRLARVLHHELVHAALGQAAPSFVLPAWVNEGLAEWFEARAHGRRGPSARELGVLVEAGRQGALLPLAALSAPSLVHLDPTRVGLGYLQSFALVDHLVRRSGERSLAEFCAQLVRTRNLERSLQRVHGLGTARLEREFLEFLGAL